MKVTSRLREQVDSILTPAIFAANVSRGRWQLTRHLDAIDQAIVDTILGHTAPILVIEAPPRHGKSELISRYLPAWYLGRYPERRVMLVGYAAAFARSWGRKARSLLADHGRETFGVEVDLGVRAAADWGLRGYEGGMVTAGMGGPLTGRGANLLIIDDPIKNAEQAQSAAIRENHWDWWQTTASTRIEPGGCAIIIATRWNEDDLSGRLIKAADKDEGCPVRRLRLPAIAEEYDPLGRLPGEALWPARWPIERLERLRLQKDSHWWHALYQQRPAGDGRSTWPAAYFGDHLWANEFPAAFELSALALDPSQGRARGDYSAIVFVGVSGGLLWIDASIARRPPEKSVCDAIDMAIRYGPHAVAVESNSFQSLLAPEFDRQCRDRRLPPLPIHLVEQRVPKETRIKRLGPHLLREKLRLRDTLDCRQLVQQLREFPLAGYDDGPDALELAIRALTALVGRSRRDADPTLEFAWSE
jgi:predicted phage terminase large subunit-like protein